MSKRQEKHEADSSHGAEAGPEAATAAAVEPQPGADQSGNPDLRAEIDRLMAENAELQDQLLRRRADFDNYRKRMERERLERIEYAAMEAVKQLLPVLDNFMHAKNAATADENYRKGVEMIYQSFYDTLKNLGLEPMEAKGAQFDPNLHHAIEQVPTANVPEDTVIDELQKGFLFKGKLLRPAMVRVSVTP